MIVTTGYGYYKLNGNIIMKYELPIGEHPDPVGMEVVEVASKGALNAIEINQEANRGDRLGNS